MAERLSRLHRPKTAFFSTLAGPRTCWTSCRKKRFCGVALVGFRLPTRAKQSCSKPVDSLRKKPFAKLQEVEKPATSCVEEPAASYVLSLGLLQLRILLFSSPLSLGAFSILRSTSVQCPAQLLARKLNPPLRSLCHNPLHRTFSLNTA